MRWMEGTSSALVTGWWDKTLKYWDLRSPQPIATVTLPERCYAMDLAYPLLVVATAERHILTFSLTNPTQPMKTIASPLKFQTRSIACYPNATGFAVGSIEGRVGLQYLEEKPPNMNFAYRCHREENNAYSVNSIAFHPIYGTFSTAGSDGMFNFWDKESKQRLKSSSHFGAPISASAFNRNGSIYAYALSYDWSKGHEHHQQGSKNTIMLHAVQDADIKPRPLQAKKR
jgi:mRNA export factor